MRRKQFNPLDLYQRIDFKRALEEHSERYDDPTDPRWPLYNALKLAAHDPTTTQYMLDMGKDVLGEALHHVLKIVAGIQHRQIEAGETTRVTAVQVRMCLRLLPEVMQARVVALVAKLDEPLTVAETVVHERLRTEATLVRVGELMNRYMQGVEDISIIEDILALCERHVAGTAAHRDTFDPDDVVDDVDGEEAGLRFADEEMHRHIRPLQPGDTCLVAARVGQGKTTYLAEQVAHFLPQLQPGDTVLYLNNEGTAKRVKQRLLCAATGRSMQELAAMRKAGTLRAAWEEVRNGVDVQVQDIHGASLGEVERCIRKAKPKVVVLDMPAHIRHSGNLKKHEALEQTWQRLRELAATLGTIVIGTHQLAAEADGQLYPPLSALYEARTGLTGALDLVVFIGSGGDGTNVRGVSIVKEKMRLDGASQYRRMALLDPVKARFDYSYDQVQEFADLGLAVK